MRHHSSTDQVKADILSIFKTLTDTEREIRQRNEARRLRQARQTIEERREQKRLQQELSDGWDLEEIH
ncbi:PA3496 family putative envelope integrity protein [Marinospirillum alkaliphilum]|uniref:Uncharacterized protein n=1 Tax=Marinospirillum alkaliphilum DSM 21637 TaxID=1122209 RepID=A0A1K1Y2W4_9GAMM|nr:hypothetical protein [Marinospirillum alkaliphilum]SFX56322.1 hypothetical protein SAMN02745752_02097 [Marinospirillum alkaliphilum DSM 21637]